MQLSQNKWRIGIAIAIMVFILFFVVIAPERSANQLGSSYSSKPSGYGAWYSYMTNQPEVEINRWRQPVTQLQSDSPVTLIQVHSFPPLDLPRDWVSKGNTLIILGVEAEATGANFSTLHPTSGGDVKIETRRRLSNKLKADGILLEDNYGAIAWETNIEKGKIIYIATPYLAANAYQDYPANYQFLAELASRNGQEIWIDEYIHGYRDKVCPVSENPNQNGMCENNLETEDTFLAYFSRTSIFPLFIQSLVLFLVAVWGGWRSFGNPQPLSQPIIDNTQVYVDALGQVLQKAKKTDYVVQTVGAYQTKMLQMSLGLGDDLLESDTITNTLVKHHSQTPKDVNNWLILQKSKKHLTETELLAWLIQGQKIRDSIENEAK